MSINGTAVDTKTYDDLIIPGSRPLTWDETIASGQTLVRGTILGKVTSGGQLKACDQDAGDGSETARFVLPEAVDTTSGAKTRPVYVRGEFNKNHCTLLNPSNTDIDTARDELRAVGIYLLDSVEN